MKHQFKILLAIIVAALMIALLPSANARQSAPTAQQIMEKTMAAYADCKSYSDSGRVETLFIMKHGKRTTVKPFSTAFVRPDAFRFEYQERDGEKDWRRYIVWQKASDIKSWWTLKPEVKELESLSMALAGPTGVSGGSAIRVPSLLLPSSMANGLKFLTELKLLSEEPIGVHSAYKIEAKDSSGRIQTLWIDTQRFLILKVFQKIKFEANSSVNPRSDGFEMETTTFYDPQINEPVPAAKLEPGIPTQ
ncbi:MAG: LolA family protein [Blastocatellia bacterium]